MADDDPSEPDWNDPSAFDSSVGILPPQQMGMDVDLELYNILKDASVPQFSMMGMPQPFVEGDRASSHLPPPHGHFSLMAPLDGPAFDDSLHVHQQQEQQQPPPPPQLPQSPAMSTTSTTLPRDAAASPAMSSATAGSSYDKAPRKSSRGSRTYATKKDLANLQGEAKERAKARLERKAELARASRRRKKAYVKNLEESVKSLEQSLEELQRKFTVSRGDDAEREHIAEQASVRDKLSQLLDSSSISPEMVQEIARLTKQYVKNSRRRQGTVGPLFDKVQRAVAPGAQVKFALWALSNKDDSFYEDENSVWARMREHLELTPNQHEQIKSMRGAGQAESLALQRLENQLRDVQMAAAQHLTRLNELMDTLQSVLSPVQIAKFYLWVEENQWAMSMLR